MFSSLKLYLVLTMIIAFGGGYLYIQSLLSDIEQAERNNMILEDAINEQEKVIQQRETEFRRIRSINNSLNSEIEQQRKVIEELDEKFNIRANGTSRDLGKITRDKPGLVNNIINNATNDANRCFEIITGAEIKEDEKNNECQDYINSIDK